MPLNVNLKPSADTYGNSYSFFEWFSTYGKYLLVIFNITLFAFYTYKTSLIRKRALLKEEIQKMEIDIETLKPLALEYNKTQKVTKLVEKARKEDVKPTFLINFLKSSTPVGISIEKIDAKQGELMLTAVSKSPEIFSSFVAAMINEKRFLSVILISSTKIEKEDSYISKFKLIYK